MSVNLTLFPRQVTWNSHTWDASAGAPLRLEYRCGGRALAERTGADEYPRFVAVAGQECVLQLAMRELALALAPGQKSNLVASVKTPAGIVTFTFSGMVLVDVAGRQPHGEAGECVLSFQHESSDGASSPLQVEG